MGIGVGHFESVGFAEGSSVVHLSLKYTTDRASSSIPFNFQ